MKKILLCTHDPFLIKGLYGVLRDEGCDVDITDHPAHAVKIIMDNAYEAVMLDSRAFGLPSEDAVHIIKTVCPDIKVILLGYDEFEAATNCFKVPLDLAILKNLVHGLTHTQSISYKTKEEKVWL